MLAQIKRRNLDKQDTKVETVQSIKLDGTVQKRVYSAIISFLQATVIYDSIFLDFFSSLISIFNYY